MSTSGIHGFSTQGRRYWEKKGLLPDPADATLFSLRTRRFIDQCLQLGFRPAQLMKFRAAARTEQRDLHHLTVYSSEAGPLTRELVVKTGGILEEPGTGQMLFLFSAPLLPEVSVLSGYLDPLEEIFTDEQTDEVLEKRLELFVSDHPQSTSAWIELGNLQFGRSAFREALYSYEQAVLADPDCAEAYYNEAGCYAHLKEYAVAIRRYHRCLQLKPDFPEALYSLGLLYLSLNYRGPALQTLQAVVRIGHSEWAESARQFIEDIEQLSLYEDVEQPL